MDRQAVLGDWYWRLYHGWALTNLGLSTGDLTRARDDGESFLASAEATAERTWRALACEANARIALAAGETRRAQDLATRALAAIEGFEAPVAGWQAHATAADVARACGDAGAATRHREASRDIIVALNGAPVTSLADLRAKVDALPSNAACVLRVQRDKVLVYVALELE